MAEVPNASLTKVLARKVLPRRIWTMLRLARISHGVEHYPARWVRHIYGGIPLEVYLTDPMAAGWYDHDWPELAEIELLKAHRLRPGARVFDIGAHQCVVALMLASAVGPAGQVVAVEPNPHNVAAAMRNRERNKAAQLEIVEAGAGEQSGTLVLNQSLNARVDDGSGEWGKRTVPCVSVDDLTARYGIPDVLFIDVEGFEVKVLQGAAQTMRYRPDCFVEVHVGCGLENYGYSAASVLSFFPEPDYHIFFAPQSEPTFRTLESCSTLPAERFFLAAVCETSKDVD